MKTVYMVAALAVSAAYSGEALAVVAAQERPMVYVAFWFDTEDFILPQADDAAKRLAEMFTARGTAATFKVVGEKAKVLEQRGRTDVILALAKNDIGYHSTFHSMHPTPAEYTRDLDWREGVAEFTRREGVGLEVVRRVFGVNPSCYGQPGSSWTPQSYAAMKAWGIPLYLDACAHVNLNNRPFWYCGILTVLNMGDCVMRTGWSDEEVRQACAKFDEVHHRLIAEGGGLVSIYYHPCEFVHKEFWDGVNFAYGANPPRSEWKLPPMKSPQEQEQAFHAFEAYLSHISGHPQVQLVTARQIPSLYADRAYSLSLGEAEIRAIAAAFQKRLSYVDTGSCTVSAAEGLLALARYTAGGRPKAGPDRIDVDFAYGPASRPQRFTAEGTFPRPAIEQAAQDLVDSVHQTGQLPPIVWVAGRPVRLEDFAVTLASVVASASDKDDVTLRQAELDARRFVADDSPDLWSWVIFPKGFSAPHMMDLAKLQAWTLKPATLRK
jgi:hypothetical protein